VHSCHFGKEPKAENKKLLTLFIGELLSLAFGTVDIVEGPPPQWPVAAFLK
jgi:hypothetical protein